ncbi:MAG TPA: fibronectin type III domain-containing protein, partial [Acidimicrobiia bacterium]|nr:fibronectin type III domain-containing protein [Acidimicrobiia bacterium]
LIADSTNNRIRVIAVSASNPGYPLVGCFTTGPCVWSAGNIYTIAGDGLGNYNGDGIPATVAQLNAPTDVTVDHAGNPVIVDSLNGRVRVIAVSALNPGYPVPHWTVGDIYTIAGTAAGILHYSGDGGYATNAQLFTPERATVDASGNVIIADTGNERVRVVAISATNPGYPLAGCVGPCTWTLGYIYTMAGDGFMGFSGDYLPATGTEVNSPTGVAVDQAGNLYIADTGNARVRIVAVSASNPGYPLVSWTVGDMYTIAGTGGAGYGGDGFAAASALINAAQGVTFDAHRNVVIADTGNERVRVVAVSASNPGYPLAGCAGACTWTAGDIYTVAGNGTGGFNADGILATKAELYSPTGVAVDRHGNFDIADSVNSRIREVAIGPASTVPCAPRSVSASSRKGHAVVHWSTPSCTGGSAITGYVVTPYLKSTALPARTFRSNSTTEIITGLTVKKTYRFRVAARNSIGVGPASTFSNSVTISSAGALAR